MTRPRGELRRARSSRGARPRRSPAASARAPARSSSPSRCAARRPSSCRSPCRSTRAPASRTSTAAPASNSPATSTIPTGSRLVPPSRRARAAPASTVTVPCAGLAYLSHSLKLEWRTAWGANRVPTRSPAHALGEPARQQPARDHGRDPGGGGHLRRHDLRAHPAGAQRRQLVPDLERVERRVVGDLLDELGGGVDARVRGVEPVGVRQQDEQLGADEHRHLRGQEVVVAERDLVGRGRVVLVDHRHDPPARAASGACGAR